MNWLKPGFLAAILIATLGLALLLERNALVKSRGETESPRRELAQLKSENELRSKSISAAKRSATPHLPAPALQASPSADPPPDVLPATNLIFQLLHGSNAPKLTLEQVGPYLKDNHRSATSLIAAARATGDPSLLQEAMEKYPHDPQVAYAAVFKVNAAPEERR